MINPLESISSTMVSVRLPEMLKDACRKYCINVSEVTRNALWEEVISQAGKQALSEANIESANSESHHEEKGFSETSEHWKPVLGRALNLTPTMRLRRRRSGGTVEHKVGQ